MNRNRIFAVVAVLLAVGVFAIAAVFNTKNEEQKSAGAPPIDSSVLVKMHSYVKGPANAKVTVVEFLDPECESCRAMHPIVKQILNDYEGKVRFVVRYMPFHGNSHFAASALEEAREQGKFEQALDILFEKQPEWASHHQPRPELIEKYLQEIGLKPEQLKSEYLIGKHGAKIDLDQADGYKVGVTGTPTFFVNGRMLKSMGYEPLKAAIEEALK